MLEMEHAWDKFIMKIKRTTEAVVFGMAAIPIVYLAVSMGLGNGFILSPANTTHALIHGLILGVIVTFMMFPFHMSEKPKAVYVRRILGCLLEMAIFFVVLIRTALIASC